MEKGSNGEMAYVTDMKNTFIGCFTNADLSEIDQECLWRRFVSNGGVRLKFRITPSDYADIHLRKIFYELKPNTPISLIGQLSSIAKKSNLKLVFEGLTAMSAFYLPAKDFIDEQEQRMLIRVWGNSEIKIQDDGNNKYIAIPLNQNTLFKGLKLELLEYYSKVRPAFIPESCTYKVRYS